MLTENQLKQVGKPGGGWEQIKLGVCPLCVNSSKHRTPQWLASDKHIPTEGKYYYLLTSTYLYPLKPLPFRTFSDAPLSVWNALPPHPSMAQTFCDSVAGLKVTLLRCEEKGNPPMLLLKCKLVQSLWKRVWTLSKVKLKIELPCDPAIHSWAYVRTKL